MILRDRAREKAIKVFKDIPLKREEESKDAFFFFPDSSNSCLDAIAIYKETEEVVSLANYMMRKL